MRGTKPIAPQNENNNNNKIIWKKKKTLVGTAKAEEARPQGWGGPSMAFCLKAWLALTAALALGGVGGGRWQKEWM